MSADDRPVAQHRIAQRLRQAGARPVVEDRETGQDAAGSLQRGCADRVDEDDPRRRQAAGHGRSGHDRAEGVAEDDAHREPPRRRRPPAIPCTPPDRAVRPGREADSPKPGRSGEMMRSSGRCRHDRLETVVLPAEAVHREQGGRRHPPVRTPSTRSSRRARSSRAAARGGAPGAGRRARRRASRESTFGASPPLPRAGAPLPRCRRRRIPSAAWSRWHAEPLALFESPDVVARDRRLRPRDDGRRCHPRPHRDRPRRAARRAPAPMSAARDWLADPGVPIPDGAAAIHGITTARARADGRPAREVVAEVDRRAARDARRRHPGGRLQRAVRLLAAQARVACVTASRRSSRPRRSSIRSWSTRRTTATAGASARCRRSPRTMRCGSTTRTRPRPTRSRPAASLRRSPSVSRRWLPPTADELHTRQIGWARAQAASLTEYFVPIGRIEANARLDGSWPIR